MDKCSTRAAVRGHVPRPRVTAACHCHVTATCHGIWALERRREALLTRARAGTRVVLSGLSDEIASLQEQTELGALLGEEGVLRSGDRLFEGFERSMERARVLLGESSESEIFRRG